MNAVACALCARRINWPVSVRGTPEFVRDLLKKGTMIVPKQTIPHVVSEASIWKESTWNSGQSGPKAVPGQDPSPGLSFLGSNSNI